MTGKQPDAGQQVQRNGQVAPCQLLGDQGAGDGGVRVTGTAVRLGNGALHEAEFPACWISARESPAFVSVAGVRPHLFAANAATVSR